MDNALLIVVSIFMLFLCALCVFAVFVIVRDILREAREDRENRKRSTEKENKVAPESIREDKEEIKEEAISTTADAVVDVPETKPIDEADDYILPEEPAVTVVEEPIVVEPIIVEPIAEEPVAVEPTEESAVASVDESVEEEVDPSAVSFSRVNLTCEEKYQMLSAEFKRFFDEIVNYALSKPGVKELRKSGYYDYKIGAYRVLRASIKRGEIICQYTPIDEDFISYAEDSGVKIKRSDITIKVSEAVAVGAAKDSIDLIYSQIEADKARKKELALEKRRERRRRAKEMLADASEVASVETSVEEE